MRLWEKGSAVNEKIHLLSVGDDPVFDAYLLPYDCIGTRAHAKVLCDAGIINDKELSQIEGALDVIYSKACNQEIEIPYELEDCHTTLENMLVELVGDIGKKIHTGRSRNDQVNLTVRLFLRDNLKSNLQSLLKIVAVIQDNFERDKDIFLPGYTHLQPAMPSSVGMWWHAHAEAIHEHITEGINLYNLLNKNPLGAAAGFGSSLPLDRQLSADILGFTGVQRSFVDVQNSRGRYEEKYLYWLSGLGAIIEKIAWDLSLFFTKEFNFITLPDEFTTGSSIMPQKRNPDVVELMRGRAASLRGHSYQMQWITGKLPSNYHRDLQLTKAPLFDGIKSSQMLLEMFILMLPEIRFNKDKLETRKDSELYATYEAYRLVQTGIPFRDAYRSVAENIKSGQIKADQYTEQYNLTLNQVRDGMNALRKEVSDTEQKVLGLSGIDYSKMSGIPFLSLSGRLFSK